MSGIAATTTTDVGGAVPWQRRNARCLVLREGIPNPPYAMLMDAATLPSSRNASTRRGERTGAAGVAQVAADDGATLEVCAWHEAARARLTSCTPQHLS